MVKRSFSDCYLLCKLPKIAKMGGFCPALSLKNQKNGGFLRFSGKKMPVGAVKMPVFLPGVGYNPYKRLLFHCSVLIFMV